MNSPKPLILVVEDDMQNVQVLVNILKIDKYQIAVATSGKEALEKLDEFIPNLIILDLRMPGMSGEELLAIFSEKFPQIPVIIATANNDPKLIVKCMKLGAFDYIIKPVDSVRTLTSVKHALELGSQQTELDELRAHLFADKLQNPRAFSKIITRNNKMLTIFKYVESIAVTKQPVLITGDTGTGKELFAKAIHLASKRKGKFIPLNAAGIDDQMFSDTLFGHIKGAYTSAASGRKGLIESAADGTLFLDEIGDISKMSQIKLLRLLQENEYLPTGSDKYKYSNARIVLATNQNLSELVEKKTFRIDLLYRLKAHCIYIPPLKDRIDDITLLLDYFLEEAAKELDGVKKEYSPELINLLSSCEFPGNIRELKGMVFEAVINSPGKTLLWDAFRKNVSVSSNSSDNGNVSYQEISNMLECCPVLPTSLRFS